MLYRLFGLDMLAGYLKLVFVWLMSIGATESECCRACKALLAICLGVMSADGDPEMVFMVFGAVKAVCLSIGKGMFKSVGFWFCRKLEVWYVCFSEHLCNLCGSWMYWYEWVGLYSCNSVCEANSSSNISCCVSSSMCCRTKCSNWRCIWWSGIVPITGLYVKY